MATVEKSNGHENGRLDIMKKLKLHSLLSMAMIVVGVVIVIVVGYVEDDPIIPPILMIVLGTGWFIRTRLRMRML